MSSIEGRVVVITGASSGMGEAAAQHLAAQRETSCWERGALSASSR